jgi:hypothetical protein
MSQANTQAERRNGQVVKRLAARLAQAEADDGQSKCGHRPCPIAVGRAPAPPRAPPPPAPIPV